MSEYTTHFDSTSVQLSGDDSVGYDPTTGTFHTQFDADGDSNSIVVAIVDTVATVTNSDPISLPPLFATVDPEALAALVTSAREGPIEVNFSYEDCRVTVSSHGTVVVEPPGA
ncbi:HalOD1 output domain-containing protein [Halosolutus gelatinilyticus]|uniref:HalOD1 output domain-containing protein n=1 Tax=Halosolutus gelatinilyticus TaxID=2931975 RepID=UPI001FF6C59E|nr:HalOD1 output domain-containing protein [Halosolutus gelatinilyticus]